MSQPIEVAKDGTITVPSFKLPLSAALSGEAAAFLANALQASGGINLANLDTLESEAAYQAAVDAFRAGLNKMFAEPLAAELLDAFPVEREQHCLGGVQVEEFRPVGAWDKERVLINLHGGAFYSGAVHVARIESIPMANLGRFRVISVDYRQGYEHKYPAASEDVAAVYEALLGSYAPEQIGIYGGSAGGTLTLQATAWILKQDLPAPGAIGVFGSGASGSGDGSYFAAIGSAQVPPTPSVRGSRYGYLSEADPNDPLLNINAAVTAFRAKFPPCLLITGTRAFDLSPAIATHRAFCQAGVDASLHVFDGLGHCFYYNARLPEAADAYQTMVRFFQSRLAK